MTSDSRLSTSDLKRCRWCGTDPLYMEYHDKEWGKTIHDDDKVLSSS
jgi:DNA-3-methyladenine glycosylase I